MDKKRSITSQACQLLQAIQSMNSKNVCKVASLRLCPQCPHLSTWFTYDSLHFLFSPSVTSELFFQFSLLDASDLMIQRNTLFCLSLCS